jgi:hypothetical protein
MPLSPEQMQDHRFRVKLESAKREGDQMDYPSDFRPSKDVRRLLEMLDGKLPRPPVCPAPKGLLPDEIDKWFAEHPEEATQWERDYEAWERLKDSLLEIR